MIRSLKALALAAVTVAGALGATAVQASAANFNVSIAIQNDDPSQPMGLSTLPSTVSGMSVGPISAGGQDPAGGHGTWSDLLPALNRQASVQLQAFVFGSGGTAACTYTLTVKHDTNVQPYQLLFSSDAPTRCAVPNSVRTSDGQFTAQTYILHWRT